MVFCNRPMPPPPFYTYSSNLASWLGADPCLFPLSFALVFIDHLAFGPDGDLSNLRLDNLIGSAHFLDVCFLFGLSPSLYFFSYSYGLSAICEHNCEPIPFNFLFPFFFIELQDCVLLSSEFVLFGSELISNVCAGVRQVVPIQALCS